MTEEKQPIILFKDPEATIIMTSGKSSFAISVLEKGKPIHTFPIKRRVAIELGIWLIKELQ